MCSLVLDLSCDVHKDKVLDGVGVEHTTYDIIFYEYVWQFEKESMVNEDLILSASPTHYLDICNDSVIPFQSCQNSFLDVSNFDHSQNTWNVSFSFECGEDKFFCTDPPNLSSYLF